MAVDKEYVAREQRNRGELQVLIQDKVWRAPLKDGAPLANGERPYVDIVLEFQSAVDRRMAWRMADCLHALRLNQRENGVAERRFGIRTAKRLSELLGSVAADRLAEVGDWMLAGETDDELLEHMGSLPGNHPVPGHTNNCA